MGREQLVALGFTRQEINHRVRTKRLSRVCQGVYAVGHEALSDRGRMIAALLAAGPGAALSHRTAAYTVLRFTWRQVVDEKMRVVVLIAQVLARTPHTVARTPPAGG